MMNVLFAVVGAVMVAVGWWGCRNVDRLVSRSLSPQSRMHEEGVMQRGAAMLLLAGVLFLGFALYLLFRP